MPNSLSHPHGSDDPQKPDDPELRDVVALAAIAAIVAWTLTHDATVAAQVFVILAGGLRPRRR